MHSQNEKKAKLQIAVIFSLLPAIISVGNVGTQNRWRWRLPLDEPWNFSHTEQTNNGWLFHQRHGSDFPTRLFLQPLCRLETYKWTVRIEILQFTLSQRWQNCAEFHDSGTCFHITSWKDLTQVLTSQWQRNVERQRKFCWRVCGIADVPWIPVT